MKQNISFLYDFRQEFKGYALLRSYLGLARRDLKQFSQSYDQKKLYHALRGLWTFNKIIENSYDNNIKEIDLNFFTLLMSIRNGQVDKMNMIKIMKETGEKVEDARSLLSLEHQEKKISRLMNVEKLKELDQKLLSFCEDSTYKSKTQTSLLIDSVYESLESDIKYE
jgi:hypothetical protein